MKITLRFFEDDYQDCGSGVVEFDSDDLVYLTMTPTTTAWELKHEYGVNWYQGGAHKLMFMRSKQDKPPKPSEPFSRKPRYTPIWDGPPTRINF